MTIYINDIVIENLAELGKVKKSITSTASTLNGTLSLISSSKSSQLITGTQTGYSVQLPDATTISNGEEFYVINSSSQSVDLIDNASSNLKIISSGGDIKVTLIDNGTAAGSWQLENQSSGSIDWTADQGATNIDDNNVPHTSVASGNPHSVTKSEVGLANVDNTSDADKPVSTAQQTALDLKYNNTNPSGFLNETSHDALPSDNPHTVTKAQVGLGNVDNTSDVDKPVSTAQAAANTTDRARANHTGTQLASTISDFDAEVANNSAVTANTAKVTNAIFIEKFETLGTSSSGTWVSRAVPSGANKKAYITFQNNSTGTQLCGVREVGSVLERSLVLSKGGGIMTMVVNVDGSGNIETNTSNVDVSINLIGWE